MNESISIVKTRSNELEFDINIRGAQKQNPVVRLVIEDPKVHYSFNCDNTEGDKWVVGIPPLPQLTRKSYPFRLEVIIDGYFFEPYRKTLSVIPEPVVKSSKVAEKHPEKPVVNSKKKAAPTKKKVVKKRAESKPVKKAVAKEEVYIPEQPIVETPVVEPVVEPLDNFADMAAAWMNREKPVVTEQDKKVKGLIKDAMKAKPVVVETAPIVAPVALVEESKVKANDIKIKAILDSAKVK